MTRKCLQLRSFLALNPHCCNLGLDAHCSLYIYIYRDVETKWNEHLIYPLTNLHLLKGILEFIYNSLVQRFPKKLQGASSSKTLLAIHDTFLSSRLLYNGSSVKSSLFENSVRLIKRGDKRSHRSSILSAGTRICENGGGETSGE